MIEKRNWLAEKYNSIKVIIFSQRELKLLKMLSKEQQVSDWSKLDLDIEQIEYAAKDVDILPQVAKIQLAEF